MARGNRPKEALAAALALGLLACGSSEGGDALMEKAAAAGQEASLRGGGNPGVIPPGARPYGLTYGQWSARHWKWTYSLPADSHPLTDTADCSAGQSGPVWFLGGTFTPTPAGDGVLVGEATRSCTVPAGKALFFPVLSAECSILEGDGASEAELRGCAQALVDHAVDPRASVDGIAVRHLQDFRVESPLFEFGPLPANNLLGAPAGATSPSVSDGIFLMLAPLSAGAHTIHFSGAFVFTAAQDGFDFTFTLDITYHLAIAPRHREGEE